MINETYDLSFLKRVLRPDGSISLFEVVLATDNTQRSENFNSCVANYQLISMSDALGRLFV